MKYIFLIGRNKKTLTEKVAYFHKKNYTVVD